ncbi:MAG TPA: S41 family peptidase [Leptospiraceae bacterium]|nr:S41 family peptidase [Leptospiraceae bacterium]HRG74902.1 S41 family peptidase [Leptospiraceae bacterium]
MKRTSLFVTTICLTFLFSTVAYCEPTTKKPVRTTNFTYKDFESVVQAVDKHYIDKNIDVDRAYTDAAVFAMISLPHSLYLYPESYFKEREQYEEKDDILPGSTFKLSESDQFIVFDPNYKKIDEIRKARAKNEAAKPKLSNDELKKIIEREQIKKSILASRWEQIKFNKKDFDRVITFVTENLSKYKTQPLKDAYESMEDEDEAKEEFSVKDVYLAAANGYLNSLDPHSNVFLREAWEKSMKSIEDSSFEGIGAVLSGGGNREVIVENPLEDKPAVKAGVRAGDVIVAVDDKKTKGVMLDKVVKRIKGKKGTAVKLTIKRKGIAKPFDISVVRANIEIKNVSKRLIKDHEQIGYIKLSGFVKSNTESSDTEIKNAFKDLEQEAAQKNTKLKALVLDLRNNAGGYLDLAIDISDMFITKGLIVSTKSPNREADESYARMKDLTDLPLAILINAKSASASEIVASAIKHHGRGLLLGERTFGKATVQKLMDLQGNSDYVLKITQSRYYSPSGKTIQVVGVEPDIQVSAEEDGSFPFQYREENMWHHLPKIPSEGKHKDYFNVEKLKDWVTKNGTGEKYLKDHKNDPIKPDYQLIRSIDYVEAMLNANQ